MFIDGGKGGRGLEVFAEIGESAHRRHRQGEERKPGLETLILPYLDKSLQLRQDHPALHLIQTVRDEAHRFAITGHRARRQARTASTLEEIQAWAPSAGSSC